MSFRQWLTRKQDERERFYYARAGLFSFAISGLVASSVGLLLLLAGRLPEALLIIAPGCVGSVVYAALLVYWKVLN